MTRQAHYLLIVICALLGLWLLMNRLSSRSACTPITKPLIETSSAPEAPLLEIEQEQKEHWDELFSNR